MGITKQISTLSYWQIFLSVVFCVFLWFLPDILGIEPAKTSYSIRMFEFIPLFTVSAFWAHFLQLLLVGIMLFLLVNLVNTRNFLPINSTVLICIGGIVLASVQQFQYLTDSTFAILLFFVSITYFLQIGEEKNVSNALFSIIILNVCGSFFEPALLLICLLVLLLMVCYNMLSLKSLFAGLWSLILVFFVAFSVFYLTDQLSLLEKIWNYYLSYEIQLDRFWASFANYSLSELIFFAVFAVLLILTLLYNFGYVQNIKALMRFYFLLLVVMLVGSLIVCFVFFDHFPDFIIIPFLLAILQLSLFFSHQQKRFGDICFWCFLVVCVAYRTLFLIGL